MCEPKHRTETLMLGGWKVTVTPPEGTPTMWGVVAARLTMTMHEEGDSFMTDIEVKSG